MRFFHKCSTLLGAACAAFMAGALLLTPPTQAQALTHNSYSTEQLDALQQALKASVGLDVTTHVTSNGVTQRRNMRGSGFFYRYQNRTYVLTNHHVVENAAYVTLSLCDGSESRYSLMGRNIMRDPQRDFAFFEVPNSYAPAILEAANLNSLRIGQDILLIGNPFGFRCTVSRGILSQKGHYGISDGTTIVSERGNFQTDASMNPGNSGGPALVWQDGKLKVIGINTYIVAPQATQSAGLGFSTPIDMHVKLMAYMLAHDGQPFYGDIGALFASVQAVHWQDLRFEEPWRSFLARGNRGALVTNLSTRGEAYRAGLRVGDMVVQFNYQDVKNDLFLKNAIANTPPLERLVLTVVRADALHTITLHGGNTVPAAFQNTPASPYKGLSGILEVFRDDALTEALLRTVFGIDNAVTRENLRAFLLEWQLPEQPLMVKRLANLGPAHEAGVETYHIIEGVILPYRSEPVRIHTLEELEEHLRHLKQGEPITLLIAQLPRYAKSRIGSFMTPPSGSSSPSFFQGIRRKTVLLIPHPYGERSTR